MPPASNGQASAGNLMPGNWQMEWTHELYHGNDQSISTNYFSDLSVSYRTNRYEISLACNNLFGTSTLERHYFLDSRQMYSINQLRPREFLASVTFGL